MVSLLLAAAVNWLVEKPPKRWLRDKCTACMAGIKLKHAPQNRRSHRCGCQVASVFG